MKPLDLFTLDYRLWIEYTEPYFGTSKYAIHTYKTNMRSSFHTILSCLISSLKNQNKHKNFLNYRWRLKSLTIKVISLGTSFWGHNLCVNVSCSKLSSCGFPDRVILTKRLSNTTWKVTSVYKSDFLHLLHEKSTGCFYLCLFYKLLLVPWIVSINTSIADWQFFLLQHELISDTTVVSTPQWATTVCKYVSFTIIMLLPVLWLFLINYFFFINYFLIMFLKLLCSVTLSRIFLIFTVGQQKFIRKLYFYIS